MRVECWGGFVFVNMDLDAEPLLDFLDPLPTLLAPYRFDELRFRTYRSTIIAANWKAVVDAFNESYHVQGLHEQILPWTDDTSIAYEQFDRHSHYGRLPGARRELRPSLRLGLRPDEYDEGEILGALVAGLGGAFLGEERAAVDELRASGPPADRSLLDAYQERRMTLLAERGFDVSGFTPDLMTSADDVFWFPNMVGPVYPGSALLFRVRPNGRDPHSAIKDTWVLEWPRPGEEWKMPERRFYADWRERKWGEITEQDYTNLANVQRGMRSRGFEGSRLGIEAGEQRPAHAPSRGSLPDRLGPIRHGRAGALGCARRNGRGAWPRRRRRGAGTRARDRVATRPRRRTPSSRSAARA